MMFNHLSGVEEEVGRDDDQTAFGGIVQIGIAGLVHCILLISIVSYRAVCFVIYTPARERKGPTFVKRVIFHLLLWLAIASDVPMYGSFIDVESYQLSTYSWHKLESGWMFVAYSVVVSDWLAVLRDINEDSETTYICKWWALFASNLVVIAICVSNFAECLRQDNITDFTEGAIYFMGLISQFASVLLLTVVILHSGLKLAFRLRTATRIEDGVRATRRLSKRTSDGDGNPSALSPSKRESAPSPVKDLETSLSGGGHDSGLEAAKEVSAVRARNSAYSGVEVQGWTRKKKLAIRQSRQAEFLAALRRLNIVMAACVLCNLLCITMLALNFVLGYESSAKEYVFNVYLFWALYSWVPLWGPVLALLYLVTPQKHRWSSRRGARRRRMKRSAPGAGNNSSQVDYGNPRDGDNNNDYRGNSEGGAIVAIGENNSRLFSPVANADATGGEGDLTTLLLPPHGDDKGGDSGAAAVAVAAAANADLQINIIGFNGDDAASNSQSGSQRMSQASSLSGDGEGDVDVEGGGGNGSNYTGSSYYSGEDSDGSDDDRYGYDYEYHYESSSYASNSTITDSVTSSIISELSQQYKYNPNRGNSFSHGHGHGGLGGAGGHMSAGIRKAVMATPGAGGYLSPAGGSVNNNPGSKHHQSPYSLRTESAEGPTDPHADADADADVDTDAEEAGERESSASLDSSPQNVYLSSGQGGARADKLRYDHSYKDYAYVAARK